MPLLRFVLLIVLVFMFLTVLRGLRIFLAAFLGRPAPGREGRVRDASRRIREADMVRDPVCGTWVDRRMALVVERAGKTVPVCSEKCRARLEAGDPEARAR
jgi:YHS domain-containing protein